MQFKDREDAGRQLAEKLKSKALSFDLIFGIPRGGIPVAKEISRNLGKEIDIILNEKIPLPGSPGVGCGAVTELGVYALNNALVSRLHFSQCRIEYLISKAEEELNYKKRFYKRYNAFPRLNDLNVVLVDEGLASGFSAIAAIRSLRRAGSRRVILAVPTSSNNAYKMVEKEADEIIVLDVSSDPFYTVSKYYQQWEILSDHEAAEILFSKILT